MKVELNLSQRAIITTFLRKRALELKDEGSAEDAQELIALANHVETQKASEPLRVNNRDLEV